MDRLTQLAQARKYSSNHTWLFQELEPNTFALYSAAGRDLIHIGPIEEILEHYRNRKHIEPRAYQPRVSKLEHLLPKLEFKL